MMTSEREELTAILKDREDWHPDDLAAAVAAILVAGYRKPGMVLTVGDLGPAMQRTVRKEQWEIVIGHPDYSSHHIRFPSTVVTYEQAKAYRDTHFPTSELRCEVTETWTAAPKEATDA